MWRTLCSLSMLALLTSNSGCTICCDPYINHYMSQGGVIQRTEMNHGRVGSLLSENAYADETQWQDGTIVDEGIIMNEGQWVEGASYVDADGNEILVEDDQIDSEGWADDQDRP